MTRFQSLTSSGFDRGPVARLREVLRHRPDSEHDLSLNRLLITSVVMIYLVIARDLGSVAAEEALDVVWLKVAAFGLVSLGLFVHLLAHPGVSHFRRVVGLVSDVAIFSYGLHACDEAGAALFPIYLWVILGNGFRFDRRYLTLAAAVSVIGFVCVALTTPFWRANPIFDIGLLIGLVGIPAYASGLIGKLYEAKRQAEEASRAKSLFLASVSHELRTPLNAIIGLSDLLGRSALDADQRHMSRVIGQSGATLLALINSLLDFSRIEAGRVEAKAETVDLPLLLRDVREIVGVQAFAKGVRVAVHVTPRTPRLVSSDRRHLEEIFTNLAGNAVKFTASGTVCIRVDAVPIGASFRLRVEVSDTGIGISEDAQARIFESFTQADGTIIDRFGGTGLGLAIVRQLVRLHGGEIAVTSTVGEGSTFSFDLVVRAASDATAPGGPMPPLVMLGASAVRLDGVAEPVLCAQPGEAVRAIARLRERGVRRPIVVVDAVAFRDRLEAVGRSLIGTSPADEPCLVLLSDGPWLERLGPELCSLYTTTISRGATTPLGLVADLSVPAEEVPEAAPVAARRGLSILVAEDNKTNQMVIGKILERGGHRVAFADNGEEAVDAMLRDGFDVVLMDINMPVMNGIEATKTYRFAALGRKHLPILALTADATADAEGRCREVGMDGCLTKPIEPERLLAMIEAVVAPETGGPVEAPVPEAVPDAAVEQPIIDTAKLADLEQLGGRDFVDELVAQFVGEASGILSSLSQAVAEENVSAFQDRIHALRSGAANVGAARVYQMCLDWRRTDARELAIEGEMRLRRLEEEFGRVREIIERRGDD